MLLENYSDYEKATRETFGECSESVLLRYLKDMEEANKEINARVTKYSRQVILQALSDDFEVASAYWISPEGKIKKVKTTHIKEIVNNPEKFGLTADYIKEVYKRHNEGIGSEGDSRDEIVEKLCCDNWIRIRCYYSEGYYSIDVGRLLPDNRAYLYQWAGKMIEADVNCKSFKVKLKQFMKNTEIEYELSDFIKEVNGE